MRGLQWYLETFLIVDSGQWVIKATLAFRRARDHPNARQAVQNFLFFHKAALAGDQARLEALWNEAGLGPFPKPSA